MEIKPTSLQLVLEQNRSALLRFLRARLQGRDVADAEDILQTVFIKLETIRADGPIAEPLAFVYRVADNTARDWLRSLSRRMARDAKWADENRKFDDSHDLREDLEDRDRLQRIAAVLDELPERTVQIFRACRIEGYGQAEIAREMGISLSAVEKHLQRAYKAVAHFRAKEDNAGFDR